MRSWMKNNMSRRRAEGELKLEKQEKEELEEEQKLVIGG